MKLNDPLLIEQTYTTHVQEIEVLYWILEDALFIGNNSKAKSILEILLYAAKYRPELIQQGLKSPYKKRLREICYELLANKRVVTYDPVVMRPDIQPRKIPFKLEKELKIYLIKNSTILTDVVDPQCRITGSEVDTENGYRCDIVAESDTHFYPTELKIAQGNHQVVSQCSKYCFYFYRKLRYDRFKHVQGIVVAPGFDAWSVNELRKEGHWIFNIKPVSDSDIALERIY